MGTHKGQLIVTRREGESLIIGGTVKVVVNRIMGGKVELITIAPREISVNREEVELRKRGA